MQKITPFLWFNGNAAEGGEFYADAFPTTTAKITARYPEKDLPDFQRDLAGEALTVEVDIDGFQIVLINAGPNYRPNIASSFTIRFDPGRDPDASQTLDRVAAKLSEGGVVHMPVGEYPFSPRYGWIEDRYGANWQLTLPYESDVSAPFVSPGLLFGSTAQNRAREAIELYTSLIPNSKIGMIAEYPQATGPARAGDVMYSDFTLAGQGFVAMDSGVEQTETFTPGFSLSIACADQDEIDRLWSALSTVPEAEQCGWCVDRFGVSWQIVPAAMGELLSTPAAYAAMMSMKKIDIATLKAAG